jgi:hypothetical protein
MRAIAKTDDELYSIVAKVTKLDKKKRVCDVEPLNGDAALFGVRLQADVEKSDGVVIFPKVGSSVIVTFINEKTGYVAQVTTIESIEFVIDNLKIKYNTEGVHIENKGINLKDVFEGIIDEATAAFDMISTLKIIVPTGIGTPSPDVIAKATLEKTKLAALKQKLNQILK